MPTFLGMQTVPQPPQLVMSLVLSTQAALQHDVLFMQAVPQRAQLAESDVTSTHLLSQQVTRLEAPPSSPWPCAAFTHWSLVEQPGTQEYWLFLPAQYWPTGHLSSSGRQGTHRPEGLSHL